MKGYFDCDDVWLWHIARICRGEGGGLSTCSGTACPGAAWSSPSHSPACPHCPAIGIYRGQCSLQAGAMTGEMKAAASARGKSQQSIPGSSPWPVFC
eukprot:1158400-Pelagomonas_calceolata.AAC.5